LGIKCRWDGKEKKNKKVVNLSRKEVLVPVCPEQLGGLSTPRKPAEQKGQKVFTKSENIFTKRPVMVAWFFNKKFLAFII
jgi:uncharacterized protein YbbK (DUF523 family)